MKRIAQRKQHLLNLKALINDHREAIIDALNRDYGNRSRHETLLAEMITVTDDINGSIKHLKQWTKVEKRHVDHSLYFGAKNRVIPQPLGGDWNYCAVEFSHQFDVFTVVSRVCCGKYGYG